MILELLDQEEGGKVAVFGEKERRPDTYKGAERRRDHRRVLGDRRLETRFELDKPDRRVCSGRRGTDRRPGLR